MQLDAMSRDLEFVEERLLREMAHHEEDASLAITLDRLRALRATVAAIQAKHKVNVF